jgi:maltoporin
MKKCFFIAAAIVLISSTIRAQETHFGLKAGLNSNSVKISNGEDYDSKTGFHVGGLAHIHVTRHFAVQPEIVYSTQGGKDGDDFKFKLNYINVPVLAQYMFDEGFRLQTGPQLGFLTTAKTKTGDLEVNRKDELSSIDFSWAFGASYLCRQGLGIDARYNLGINNISEDNSFEARNRVFQVGLFYQFMHGRKGK